MNAMRRGWVIVAFGVLMTSACAAMRVNSFVEGGADVTRYRTYDWAPPDTQATGDPRLDNNPFFRERIQAQVEMRFGRRGFEQTTASTPADLTVHDHASVAQEVNANGVGQSNMQCNDCARSIYDAGTIVVDLVDARTSRLVWRGWAERSIDEAIDDQAFMERRIDEAVDRIMGWLPRRLRVRAPSSDATSFAQAELA